MPSISRPLNCGVTYKESYVSFVFPFDYTASAELFAAQGRAGLRYRRFARAAEAIRYAREILPKVLWGPSIEVNDKRYNARQIRALYESHRYPLLASIPQCEGATSYLIRSG